MKNKILQISGINSHSDTNPAKISVTWGQFIRRCATPMIRGALPLGSYLAADKATRDRQKDGPAIIAGRYHETSTRSQNSLESLSLVPLDLDDSPYSFDELCIALNGFESVVFTSYSHSQHAPKYRVYLPLQVPITGQIKPVLERIIDYFDDHLGHVDQACRRPNQLYYTPACPPGGAHLYKFSHLAGYVLNAEDFPATPSTAGPKSQAPSAPEFTIASNIAGNKPGDKFNATTNWADLLEPLGWTHCYRNHWTRPGKKFGVSGSVLHAGFFVHSTDPATAPFVAGKTYSLFGAFATIYHQGDYSRAAQALKRLGY